MSHWRVQQWSTFASRWLIYDAYKQCPMISGEKVAQFLNGRHKPIFFPSSLVGDHVVVINTRHIAAKDNSMYWRRFLYTNHTRFGKLRIEQTMEEVHRKDPTRVMYLEIRANLHNCKARLAWLENMHLYPDGIETVPKEILGNVSGVIKQVLPVHRRLDEYSEEELRSFPKLFDWPDEYAPRASKKDLEYPQTPLAKYGPL